MHEFFFPLARRHPDSTFGPSSRAGSRDGKIRSTLSWVGASLPLGAAAVAIVAFSLYRATLVPSFDLGDTASFQTTVGLPVITPRAGYPLYFAIAKLFVWTKGGEPAHALNLLSAIEGASACGLIVLVASELSGSVLAATAAALLFAGSYTFWSQAIIAEVYALHVLLIALTLLLLLRWARQPTLGNLACFFAAYALSFGNHLSMILLAPGCAMFLLSAAPRGWRSMFAPQVVVLAAVLAIAGALQYGWNLYALWLAPTPPRSSVDALRTFWFDVTKLDWRDTMVLQVPASMLAQRVRMYAFDVGQQFGWIGPLLSVAGAIHLIRTNSRRAALVLLVYVVNAVFAFSYNVGDPHVFFLPSHLMLALLAASGIVLVAKLTAARGLIALLAIALAGSRIYRDYPALDRSADRRPTQVLTALTAGLDDQHAVLLIDLNWQLQNGLSYFGKETRPEVAYARMPDVILYAPALIRDNLAIGRDIALTERAHLELNAAYGPLFPAARDPRAPVTRLADLVRDLPRGTRYALCVLRPSHEFPIEGEDLADTLRLLTGGRISSVHQDDYAALAGVVGEEPVLTRISSAPFRATVTLDGVRVDVRMESWLAFDTIRRMGFGQIVAAHRHTLIVERGVSFVAFDAAGRPLRSGYAGSLFAPQPRYLIRASLSQQ